MSLGLNEYQAAAQRLDVTSVKIDDFLDPIVRALDLVSQLVSDQDRSVFEHGHDQLKAVRHILRLWYPILGMCGEAGEIANKAKKIIRDGKYDVEELVYEAGDVLWYIADFGPHLSTPYTLEHVAEWNLVKLHSREDEGTLHGEGDSR